MMRYALLVLTTAWLLSSFDAAVGQSPTVSEAQKALEKSVAGKGLTLLQPVSVDTIGEDEYTELTFDVQADVSLVIRAACSSSCNELDLKMFNAAGAALGDDTSGSATPQVALAAGRHPTRIMVMADMLSCDNETCGVAVGVYKR